MTDVTKESLIQRVEALIEKGVEGIADALHDAIEVVESLFSGDDAGNEEPVADGADGSESDDQQAGNDSPTSGNADTAAPADAEPVEPDAPPAA